MKLNLLDRMRDKFYKIEIEKNKVNYIQKFFRWAAMSKRFTFVFVITFVRLNNFYLMVIILNVTIEVIVLIIIMIVMFTVTYYFVAKFINLYNSLLLVSTTVEWRIICSFNTLIKKMVTIISHILILAYLLFNNDLAFEI